MMMMNQWKARGLWQINIRDRERENCLQHCSEVKRAPGTSHDDGGALQYCSEVKRAPGTSSHDDGVLQHCIEVKRAPGTSHNDGALQ